MTVFRCPNDESKLLEADELVNARVKCRRCRKVVNPVAEGSVVHHRTLRCTTCKRTQHLERPRNPRTLCIPCGTQTLEVVEEMRSSPAPSVVRQGVPHAR